MRIQGLLVLMAGSLVLVACGGGFSESGYGRLPDACSLLDSRSAARVTGDLASPSSSPAPDIQPGDKQSVCTWSLASSGGRTVYIASSIRPAKDGGIARAKKSYDLDKSDSCKEEGSCREVAGLADDVYWLSDSIGTVSFYALEKNIQVLLSCIPGVKERTQQGATPVDLSGVCAGLVRLAIGNVRKSA